MSSGATPSTVEAAETGESVTALTGTSLATAREQVRSDLVRQIHRARASIRALLPAIVADEDALAERRSELATLQRKTRAAEQQCAEIMEALGMVARRLGTSDSMIITPTDTSLVRSPDSQVLQLSTDQTDGSSEAGVLGKPSVRFYGMDSPASRRGATGAQLRATIAEEESRLERELAALRTESGQLASQVRLVSAEIAALPGCASSPRERAGQLAGVGSLSTVIQRSRERQQEAQLRHQVESLRAETRQLAARLKTLETEAQAAAVVASPAGEGSPRPTRTPPRAGMARRLEVDELEREAAETKREVAAAERKLVHDTRTHQQWTHTVACLEERLRQTQLRSTVPGDVIAVIRKQHTAAAAAKRQA